MKKRILMTGGGTLGSVTPLLAIYDAWRRKEEVDVAWIGTPRGPEGELIRSRRIPFYEVAAPKFDRTRLWRIFAVPPMFIAALVKSLRILREVRPQMVFTAGGYVSVPIVWMAWVLRIPCWVHQLDVTPGLANRLMAPFAKRVSVTWEASAAAFSAKKVLVVGGMERDTVRQGDAQKARKHYGFSAEIPTVLFLGGSTGSMDINEAARVIMPDLVQKAQVIHMTGAGKEGAGFAHPRYVSMEFANREMGDILAAADVIVSRAGMGAMFDIASLQKASVIIPLPGTHQEANAQMLAKADAAIVLGKINPQILKQEIEKLMANEVRRKELGRNIARLIPVRAQDEIVKKARELLHEET